MQRFKRGDKVLIVASTCYPSPGTRACIGKDGTVVSVDNLEEYVNCYRIMIDSEHSVEHWWFFQNDLIPLELPE